jgi:glycerol-3-phosphate cytidylyltransferase
MNKTIGYTTGVFDLFHIGHLRLLKRAKMHCDYLIVGVSTDELVHSYKKKDPIIPFAHRLEIVGSISYVDEVIVQTHRDKKKQFDEICYDMLFVGDDWKNDPLWLDLEVYLEKENAKVTYFPYTKTISTTKYTEMLQNLYDLENSHK